MSLAVENESGIEANGLDAEQVTQVGRRTHLGSTSDQQELHDLLMDKREMIDEYFSLAIDEEGRVESLPMLLQRYSPNLDRLPHFLLCLGTRVSGKKDRAHWV